MTQPRRTYLITGAANRIGRGLVMGLAWQDDTIVIHYNSSESSAQQLSQEITEMGCKAFTIAADLGSPTQN